MYQTEYTNMTTRKTTKTPAAKKSTKKTPALDVLPQTRDLVYAAAMNVARSKMLSVLPELHERYGSPDVPHGEESLFEESKQMRDEYLERRWKMFLAELSTRGLEVKNKLSVQAAHNTLSPKEETQMSKSKKAEKTQQAPAARELKHEYVTTPHGEFRKGSVLHAIYRSWDLKSGATKEEILNRLCEEFGEERRDAMRYTVNTQTSEMPGKRGFTLGRDENGRYGIHIEGRFSGRVLSAEQKKNRAEKEKLKAEKLAAREKKQAEKKKLAEKRAAEKQAAKDKQKKESNKEKAKAKGITLNVPGEVVSA